MSSWSLLLRLLPRGNRLDDHPVAQRVMALPPRWVGIGRGLWQCAVLSIVPSCVLSGLLIFTGESGLSVMVLSGTLCFLFPLFVISPSLVLWVLPLSLALTPAVVRERERRTWDMLRVTPLGTESILLAKAAGGLWWLRSLLRNGQILIVLVAFSSGFFLFTRWRDTVATITPGASMLLMTLAGTIITSAGAVIVLADRAQQVVLMAVLALAASVSARSERAALAGGVALAFGAWLAETALGVLVLTLAPAHTLTYSGLRVMLVVALGPVGAAMIDLPAGTMLLAAALTLIGREIAVRAAWRWVCAAARA